MKSRLVAVIVGTRPEAVKLAPVIKAIDEHPGLRRTLITTGQHEEMVTTVLDIFGLSSDVSLQLARTGQGLHELATEVISAVAPLFAELRPDAVVVQGDTTSAMAAALTAFHDGIPVAHVEAGLRTGDMANPFPEEANRRLISVLTTLHLPPTEKARQALVAGGIDGDDIVVTGNTVIDAMLETLARGVRGPDFAEVSDLLDQPVLLTTAAPPRGVGQRPVLHRPCPRGPWPRPVRSSQVLLPLHRNPRVRERARADPRRLCRTSGSPIR